MTDNMPVLYINVMGSLPSDFARDVFLWATDKFQNDRHAYKADAFAREADALVNSVSLLLRLREKTVTDPRLKLSQEASDDLVGFILTRHANWRTGGNRKPAYAIKGTHND